MRKLSSELPAFDYDGRLYVAVDIHLDDHVACIELIDPLDTPREDGWQPVTCLDVGCGRPRTASARAMRAIIDSHPVWTYFTRGRRKLSYERKHP